MKLSAPDKVMPGFEVMETSLSSSRLSRESRVCEIEKARARQQNGSKLGRGRVYIFACCHGDMHMGTPVPKILVIWVSPVTQTLTLTQIAKVIYMRGGYPYH